MKIKIIKKQDKNITEKAYKFKVGALAVYPAHGVGLIESIEEKEINGEHHDFYILKVIENGMVIMIPTWNVDQVGLRDLVDPDDIPRIYEIIKKERSSVVDRQTWNRRYKEYMDKIKTGSIYDVAEVFRDLYHLKLTKDLSFGERKLFDTARVLLVTELSTAKKVDEAEINSEIDSFFVPLHDENLSTAPDENSETASDENAS